MTELLQAVLEHNAGIICMVNMVIKHPNYMEKTQQTFEEYTN